MAQHGDKAPSLCFALGYEGRCFLLTYGDKLPHTRFLLAKSKSASKILILFLIIVQNDGLQVEA